MTYEGPEPDCPVHGAVRALNQAMAEQRHDFDESSVLNPATGKPYPILWGEDNQPDPLCRCGAFWFSSDGGCQSLVEELRREREHRAAWLPVIDAARVLIREVKAARASKARSDIAIAGDALGPLLAAVDALDRGVPDR